MTTPGGKRRRITSLTPAPEGAVPLPQAGYGDQIWPLFLRRGVSIAARMDSILVAGDQIAMSVASTVQLRSLATRRMTGNLSAISAIRLVEIRTAETQSGRRWDAPHKLIYVMTLV